MEKYWAVIPAAGMGARVGAQIPKQYLKIKGTCILEYVLRRFCQHPRINGVIVALAEKDNYWDEIEVKSHEKILVTKGGAERCHSVLNGINYLEQYAQEDDWVMVHDAARPCLRAEDIDRLIDKLSGHPVGGLLALQVRDTMKRADADNLITDTVERAGLWHALTPQMFRLTDLKNALESALEQGLIVTDEAQALELNGVSPKLIQGHPDNIKVTYPGDIPLAEFYLGQQERAQ